MNITKVKYEKLFPTGAFLNEKVGFEMGIDLPLATSPETEHQNEQYVLCAIENLRCLAEKSHKEKYPHLYTESGSPVEVKQAPEERITDPDQALIETIGYCSSLQLLEKFRPQVERRKNPEVTQAFENKLKSLQ